MMRRLEHWAVEGNAFDRWLDRFYWGRGDAGPEESGDRVPRRPSPSAGTAQRALERDLRD